MWFLTKLRCIMKQAQIIIFLPGIDLMNNLVYVLCGFRQGKYAVISNIEAIFHHVCIRYADNDALRFLQRKGTDTKIEDYTVRVHIFGKTDSHCPANRALKRTAPEDDYQLERITEENLYMEDFFVFHEL